MKKIDEKEEFLGYLRSAFDSIILDFDKEFYEEDGILNFSRAFLGSLWYLKGMKISAELNDNGLIIRFSAKNGKPLNENMLEFASIIEKENQVVH